MISYPEWVVGPEGLRAVQATHEPDMGQQQKSPLSAELWDWIADTDQIAESTKTKSTKLNREETIRCTVWLSCGQRPHHSNLNSDSRPRVKHVTVYEEHGWDLCGGRTRVGLVWRKLTRLIIIFQGRQEIRRWYLKEDLWSYVFSYEF